MKYFLKIKEVSKKYDLSLIYLIPIIWSVLTYFSTYDIIHSELFFGFFCCLIWLSLKINEKSHRLLAITYFYFGFVTLGKICFPQLQWPAFDTATLVGFHQQVTESFLYLNFILFTFLLMPKKYLKKIEIGFIIFALIDSVLLIIRYSPKKDPYTHSFFLMNNAAFDAAFISCVIPLVLNSWKWLKLLIIPMLAACFLTKSSSGLLGPIIGLSVYFWSKYKYSKPMLWWSATFTIFVTWLCSKFITFDIFHDSGRFAIWKLSMGFWWKMLPHWTGSGIGTYLIHGSNLQIAYAVHHNPNIKAVDVFPTMHNDYLQLLFESGYIGLSLVIAVIFLTIWKLRKHPPFIASFVTFLAVSLFQMPLHWILFAALPAFLIKVSNEDAL